MPLFVVCLFNFCCVNSLKHRVYKYFSDLNLFWRALGLAWLLGARVSAAAAHPDKPGKPTGGLLLSLTSPTFQNVPIFKVRYGL